MPRVPTYDNFQVMPTVGPDQHEADAVSADKLTTGSKQMQQLGEAETQFGNTAGQIAADQGNIVNQVRVTDAMNQARQAGQTLATDPDTGYRAFKGQAALNRPGGVALPEEYGQKLQSAITDIGSKLSNPVQQRMFQEQAGQYATQFHGEVEQHMLSEFQTYGQSVYKGQGELALQGNSQLGTSDPAATQANNDLIKSSVTGAQKFNGMSDAEVAAKQNELLSGVHAQNIDTALANGDVTGAAQYFKQNSNGMVGNDLLNTTLKINAKADAWNAMHAVGQTMQNMQSQLNPSEFDRLSNIVSGTLESGNKQLNADGTPVMNKNKNGTTDYGIMQVNSDTAPEAAKMAGLPWDENRYKTDADYNKALGNAYLTQQLKTFGSIDKALGAYNTGPSAVQDAVAKAAEKGSTGNWLDYMPASTQAYVKKGVGAFNGGGGVPAFPSKMDFVNTAIAKLGDSPRTEAIAATRESAEKQYDLFVDQRKQQADQAQGRVQAELEQNNGSISQLSTQSQDDLRLINRVDPAKGTDVLRFARYAASDDKNQTNMAEYNKTVTDPSTVGKMTDPEFQNYLATNFSNADQKTIGQIRKNYLSGADDSAATLNLKAINEPLDARLEAIGISPKLMPETGSSKADNQAANQRMTSARQFVIDDIKDQQQQLQRRMTPQEISDRIDNLFATSVDFHHTFTSDKTEGVMELTPADVPTADRAGIINAFTKSGVKAPTDWDILRAYQAKKVKNAAANQ